MNGIRFKDRPSVGAVEKLEKGLEDLLSAHGLSVKIEIRREPLRLVHFRNSEETGTDFLWVERVDISNSEVQDLEVDLFGKGVPEDMQFHEMWQEAFHIQDQLYRHLGRNPALPPSTENDPYWALWDHLPSRKDATK